MSASGWADHVRRLAPYAFELFRSSSRDAFLDAAEAALASVVERMERSRRTYRQLDERGLSTLIVEMLMPFIPSSAETHSNGHVDVTIRHPLGLSFIHLTECKIWDGPDWHRHGMLQLLRYAGGREDRAMCLEFFVKHQRMVFLLGRLRKQLEDGGEPATIGRCEDHATISGAFLSCHEHESGSRLTIVHLGCHLYEAISS